MTEQESNSTLYQPSPTWSPRAKLVVGVFIFIIVAFAFYAVRAVFTPLIIAFVIAYILYPLARFIQHRTPIPHGLATGILFLILLAIVIPLMFILVPFANQQARFLLDVLIRLLEDMNNLSPEATINILGFEVFAQDVSGQVIEALLDALPSASDAFNIVLDVAQTVFLTIFTLIIGFYLTLDGDRFIDWIEDHLPPVFQKDVQFLIDEINGIWSSFLRGYLLLAFIVTVVMTFISSTIGLPRPTLMGLLAGLLEFLPGVGHLVWLITAVIVALIEGSTVFEMSNLTFVLVVVVIYILYTQINLNVLSPHIIHHDVQVHPMLVIVGVIIGASIGGFLGILLATPAIATLRVLGKYVYARLFDLDPVTLEQTHASSPNDVELDEDELNHVKSAGAKGPRLE